MIEPSRAELTVSSIAVGLSHSPRSSRRVDAGGRPLATAKDHEAVTKHMIGVRGERSRAAQDLQPALLLAPNPLEQLQREARCSWSRVLSVWVMPAA